MSETFRTKFHNFVFMRRRKNRNFNDYSRFRHVKTISLVIGVVIVLAVYSSAQVQAVLEALRAPDLPELQVIDAQGNPLPQIWVDQNWGNSESLVSADSQRFYHISQGTRTLPIPYDWFLSLEAPDSSLLSTLLKGLFFVDSEVFSNNDYLLRFGFIRGQTDTSNNPDGLPIGFTRQDSLTVPGFPTLTTGIGFNCSACHTGHFVYGEGNNKKEYIIDGGQATTDLGQLTVALGAALGQTALSSKLPFFDGRFDRFAKRLLGEQYSETRKAALESNLISVVEAAEEQTDIIDVQEGFTRLDALNRIGNQVFAKNLERPENYQPINAPVNYPPIWTSSWFQFVQYDGSIMNPLIRNAGESIGVNAVVNTTVPDESLKFSSSIPLDNMVWIEDFLKGPSFNEGLKSPPWPGGIDPGPGHDESLSNGRQVYVQKCQGCHLPALDDASLDSHFEPISYMKNSQVITASERLLKLNLIPTEHVGTDPAQSNVLITRTVNTAGNTTGPRDRWTRGVGVSDDLCTRDTNQAYRNELTGETTEPALIDDVPVRDGADVNFGLALGAIVQQVIDAWYANNFVSDPEVKMLFETDRPNCLQVGQGYKARPLNGIWSTAPFLHNGSVATIRDLVCKPQEQRPQYVLLGDITFDAENLGLKQPPSFSRQARRYVERGKLYTDEGYFILDTSIAGNSNQGHSFSDQRGPGRIGSAIEPEDCNDLLHYLKTI